jgi:tetratricopeptide (TPR) repeat protein
MTTAQPQPEGALPRRPPRRRGVDIVIALTLIGIVLVGILWGQGVKQRNLHGTQGEKYHHAKEYGKAVQEYTEAIRHDPKCALVYANRAGAYFSQGDYASAIARRRVP